MSKNLDTFADMTPIEPVDTQAIAQPSQVGNAHQPNVQQATDMNSQVENSGLDTFDNPEPIIPDNMKEGENNGEEQKQAQKSEGTEKTEVKRETDNLEMQEADESDEGTEAKVEGEEGVDTPPEETEQDSEEDSGAELEGKDIRLKVGDKRYDINENATVPVKVKGRKEFVSLKELREDYSGRKAWGQEIEKTKAKQAEVEKDRELFDEQRAQVREHFATIGEKLERAFTDPEADPLEAMNYLVELSGRNVLDYQKRMLDYFGNKALEFYEKDPAEQELYWTQKEIELLRNNQATQAKEVQDRNAQEQRLKELSQVREKYGVSEEQYQEAYNALEQAGFDVQTATSEQVSHYAALMPLAAQANELAEGFKEDLSSDEYEELVAGTADTMFKFRDIDPVKALQLTAERMGYEVYSEDAVVEQLQEKTKSPKSRLEKGFNAKKVAQKEEGHIESFDDFDNGYYKY